MTKPVVALVGRPNVGKSTLFNRIVGMRVAIVEDVAGTTRDRIYADAEWTNHQFTLIDTGGLEGEPGSDLSRLVRQQAEVAVSEADLIVFLVDARDGLTSEDSVLADLLRQTSKPVLLAANKADNRQRRDQAVEFYALGLGDVLPISAHHGTGTGDLLDEVVTRLPESTDEEEVEGIRVAIVGRPNVGKSSILNAILGEERAIVSPIPGTTRDVTDTVIAHRDERFVLLDTAGIRRRGRVDRGIESYSVIRTLRAIERCDVAFLILDASEGITSQDTHLAGFTRDAYKGLVIVANKWDLDRPSVASSAQVFSDWVKQEFNFVPYAPLLLTSAKTGRGINRLLDQALSVSQQRARRVPTSDLNRLVEKAVATHAPPSVKGKALRVYYATQIGVDPPSFTFFVNDPGLLRPTYQRYLENQFRESLGLAGTPIRMVFRPRV